MVDEPKYDVAISFLAADIQFANSLAARLGESLKIFCFTRNQEQLAGKDGIAALRLPFTVESRITVLLFRHPWGHTDWTRLEESAITEACLKRGWDSLFFVHLDKQSAIPAWLPVTHIRFALEDYNVEQLVGAIKLRVQEHGGRVAKPDAKGRAKAVEQEAEFLRERERRYRDRQWIDQTLLPAIRGIVRKAADFVNDGGGNFQPPAKSAARDQHCVSTDTRFSVTAGWKQNIYNDIRQEAYFFIREFRGPLELPGERGTYFQQPTMLNEIKIHANLVPGFDLMWSEAGKAELMSADDLANRVAMAFFDLVGKANRGDIEMPYL